MSSAPISPPRVTSYEFDYLPAYLANGVIGLRVPHLPLQRKVVVASGLAAMDPETRVEEVGHAPDPIAGDIAVNGHRLSDHIDAASFVRTLEQRQGTKISCPEEIALSLDLIDIAQFKRLIARFGKSAYGQYLQSVLDERGQDSAQV